MRMNKHEVDHPALLELSPALACYCLSVRLQATPIQMGYMLLHQQGSSAVQKPEQHDMHILPFGLHFQRAVRGSLQHQLVGIQCSNFGARLIHAPNSLSCFSPAGLVCWMAPRHQGPHPGAGRAGHPRQRAVAIQ